MWFVGYLEKTEKGVILTYNYKNKILKNAMNNMIKCIKDWDDLSENVEIEVNYKQSKINNLDNLDEAFIVKEYWEKGCNKQDYKNRLDYGYAWNNPTNVRYCIISDQSYLYKQLYRKYYDKIGNC